MGATDAVRVGVAGFTPGPWVVVEQHRGTGRGGKTPGEVIGLMVEQKYGDGRRGGRIGWPSRAFADTNQGTEALHPENLANARLIAAAPDLLAALERIGDLRMWRFENNEIIWRGSTPNGNEIETEDPFDIAREAIRKARGIQPDATPTPSERTKTEELQS